MRGTGQKSVLIAIAVGLAGATSAWAQAPAAVSDSLAGAAFLKPADPYPYGRSAASTALPLSPSADFGQWMGAPAYDNRGPDRVSSNVRSIVGPRGAVDTVRVTVVEAPVVPVTTAAAPYATAGYDVSITRNWPDAWRFKAGGVGFGVTPHAGLGVSSFGRSAEAGAELSFGGSDKGDHRSLKDIGVSNRFGDEGRWYLFAAVGGKAVGLNMARTEGDWQRAGWSQEATSALVGDGQVGLGYRKGAMQAAFGYVHREIKVQNSPRNADNGIDDSMAAFTLSIKSRK